MTNRLPILNVSNLSHCFPSSVDAVLNDINFSVAEGMKVAISGLSGSGKTTLLELISGLMPIQSGSVTLDGKDISSLNARERAWMRRHVFGFVYQQPLLLNELSVLDNILLPNKLARYYHNTPGCDFDRLIDNLGLRACLSNRAQYLSGGEKSRVSIARALINKPRILFADEPTGNLDAKNTSRVIDYILQLDSTMSVIMITHDLSIAAAFDKHYQLDNAKLHLCNLQ